MAKISVVVPVYNAEPVLRKCVESLVYGSERDIEVILCEDHGKDNSWALCQKLAQEFPNVVILRNDQNRGVSHTRNQCLDAATGEYILFVDSDDWVSGRYAQELIRTAEQNPHALTACGFCFHDEVGGYKQDYLWDHGDDGVRLVGTEGFFDLASKVLLQCLWNKVFLRGIIEKHHIRFDVTQSMGEDFQFVLDYMEAAGIKQCAVINQPLYHYIRWNNTSLMSKFGLNETNNSLHRFERLYHICGDNPVVNTQYRSHCEGLKKNLIYHISRSKKLTKQEKIQKISGFAREDAVTVLRKQQQLHFKEKIVAGLASGKQLFKRFQGRILRRKQEKHLQQLKRGLPQRDITIISQNCIGGVLYHDMEKQFLSPTIDLFFFAEDFIRFVADLPRYLGAELKLRWGDNYPIGTLDDVTIHFMHYATCQEAKDAWQRRCKRVNLERVLVLSTDRNGFTPEVYEKWKQLPYKKLLFTAKPEFAKDHESIYYPEYEANGFVGDLIPRREFYKGKVLVNIINEIQGDRA